MGRILQVLLAIVFFAAPLMSQENGSEQAEKFEVIDTENVASFLHKGEIYLIGKKSAHFQMSMQVKRPGKKDTGYTVDCFYQAPDKRLIVFKTPDAVKGLAYLRRGSDLHQYDPKNKRIVRIPIKMLQWPVFQSDFRYHDLLWTSSLARDYDIAILGLSRKFPQRLYGKVYAVMLTAKLSAKMASPRIKVWLRTSSPYILQMLFYSPNGLRNRVWTFRNMRKRGGKILATEWDMSNTGNLGYISRLTIWNAEYEKPLSADIFTMEYVKSLSE